MSVEAAIGNMKEYFAYYDGSEKSFDGIKPLLDATFHPDLQIASSGSGGEKTNMINRAEWEEQVKSNFLPAHTKCTVLEMKEIANDKFEYKVILKNDNVDVTPHSIATVKDGKVAHIQPFDEAMYQQLIGTK